jgi:hypothetical protein
MTVVSAEKLVAVVVAFPPNMMVCAAYLTVPISVLTAIAVRMAMVGRTSSLGARAPAAGADPSIGSGSSPRPS